MRTQEIAQTGWKQFCDRVQEFCQGAMLSIEFQQPDGTIATIARDLPLRGMLAAALRQAGFQVLLAGDGGEGHRAMTIHRPDVILLDLAMPGVNGWSATYPPTTCRSVTSRKS